MVWDLKNITNNFSSVTQNNIDLDSVNESISKFDSSKFDTNGLANNLFAGDSEFDSIYSGLSSRMSSILDGSNVNVNGFEDLNNVSRLLETNGGDLNSLIGQLEANGNIVRGRTVSGLKTVPSALQSTNTQAGTRSGGGRASTGSSTGRPVNGVSVGGTPGALEGTNVRAAFSDPRMVPRQLVIDCLNQMAKELNVTPQITPQGGWTTRESGTQNHPTGWAADIQIFNSSGQFCTPSDSPELYKQVIASLYRIGTGTGRVIGLGGYPRFVHFDLADWRQGYDVKHMSWNNGWSDGTYI